MWSDVQKMKMLASVQLLAFFVRSSFEILNKGDIVDNESEYEENPNIDHECSASMFMGKPLHTSKYTNQDACGHCDYSKNQI